MEFAKRRFAARVNGLPEDLKLLASFAYFEELGDADIAAVLSMDGAEIASLRRRTEEELRDYLPVPEPEAKRVEKLAEAALRDRLRKISGQQLDRAGRVQRITDALVPTISRDAVAEALEDVCQGDGGELKPDKDPQLAPRFHSARSSCALPVNVFGPWRSDPSDLTIFGTSGFQWLRFERKCPIQGLGPTRFPPNLDVLAECDTGLLAVESKLIEYLSPAKPALIEATYASAIGVLADSSWREQIERLHETPNEFAYFAASQIIKHYLGLKSCFPETEVRFVYLFWQPLDQAMHPLFAQHLAEVASFAAGLSDPLISFGFATYADVFDEWDHVFDVPALANHLRALRNRYELEIFV